MKYDIIQIRHIKTLPIQKKNKSRTNALLRIDQPPPYVAYHLYLNSDHVDPNMGLEVEVKELNHLDSMRNKNLMVRVPLLVCDPHVKVARTEMKIALVE